MLIQAPARDGYCVVCLGSVTPARTLEDAAVHLAKAYREGGECRVYGCPDPHNRRELWDWERRTLVELAAAQLV